MDHISGVSVSVFLDNQSLHVEDDGFLGHIDKGKLELQIDVAKECNVHAFIVDGKKNIVPKKTETRHSETKKRYRMRLSLLQNDSFVSFTTYPSNHLRLVEQASNDPSVDFAATGLVRIWEIAVISQHGQFFLTVQNTYQERAYRDHDNQLVYPGFPKWKKFSDFLVALLPTGMSLPSIDAYSEDTESQDEEIAANQGRVEWFNFAHGIGCLKTKNDVARVHWEEIESPVRRAFLEKGQRVSISKIVQPTRADGARRTSFKHEARGVRVLD